MGSEPTTIGDVVMEHVRQGDAGGTGTGLKHLGLDGTKHYYAANTYMAALGIIRSQESALAVAEEALRRLHACIDFCNGHGVPRIKDRAECYVADASAREALRAIEKIKGGE